MRRRALSGMLGACAVLTTGSVASCVWDTPQLHRERPWCSTHTPEGGTCWDFDGVKEVKENWTTLSSDDLTFATAAPPAHPESLPNAFQSRVEPPRVRRTYLAKQEDLTTFTRLEFAFRLDPRECRRDAGGQEPYSILVAYVAFGTGTSGRPPAVFSVSLRDDDVFVAGYASVVEEAAMFDAGVDASSYNPVERKEYEVRPDSRRWIPVVIQVVQSDTKTALAQITVDREPVEFKDIPLTGTEARVTIGLGLNAPIDEDGGSTTISCKASYDNVTLERR